MSKPRTVNNNTIKSDAKLDQMSSDGTLNPLADYKLKTKLPNRTIAFRLGITEPQVSKLINNVMPIQPCLMDKLKEITNEG